ncbi:BREX system ATP-binding domain-containing protein [Mesorhizobium sp. M0633]|uniref:BREX system ATP-binding domain-containing protein n=1 Tax=unclassified Mesorhizobium TaxID=325217 RepID=UPI00333D9A26
MEVAINKIDAKHLVKGLLNSPIAPGKYSHFINVGTDHILDALDHNYFRGDLAEGIGCFKYLEGDYGSGKTQFINSLASRASEQDVVTALVTVGAECPFNSPVAIFRAIMESFQPPIENQLNGNDSKGIEILIESWIVRRIQQLGAQLGSDVPELVQRQIEQQIGGLWRGAPDQQMASALTALSQRLLKLACGAADSVSDNELISWIRGDNVRSTVLKSMGLFEPARDENAFRRLKTVISFLRSRMGYKGFFIAFDEGTRTSSFRRGSAKQRQAIENLLTMINQNADGEFGGVMFLYAATPDFRSEVISTYRALQDRIGTKAFSRGSPMVPLINIEEANSEAVIYSIGEKLLSVFGQAHGMAWDVPTQIANMRAIVAAQKDLLFETPKPRFFVYQYCRFLDQQKDEQRPISAEQANDFVSNNEPPLDGDGA